MRITRVYTRTGDDGDTRLGGGQKLSKDSVRVDAYGTVDELSSVIGVAVAAGLEDVLSGHLERIRHELFDVGSDLCVLEDDKKKFPTAGIEQRHVDRLEETIDQLQQGLGPLEEFILPGGSSGAAALHLARTVCRRAERLVVALSRHEPIGALVIPYLNRLSDLLFVMARHENKARGFKEPYWRREGERGSGDTG